MQSCCGATENGQLLSVFWTSNDQKIHSEKHRRKHKGSIITKVAGFVGDGAHLQCMPAPSTEPTCAVDSRMHHSREQYHAIKEERGNLTLHHGGTSTSTHRACSVSHHQHNPASGPCRPRNACSVSRHLRKFLSGPKQPWTLAFFASANNFKKLLSAYLSTSIQC